MGLGTDDISKMSIHFIQGYDLALYLFKFYFVLFNKILHLFRMT